jgi:hypothetical protein
MENMRLYGNNTLANTENASIELDNNEQENEALEVEQEEYNMSNQVDDDDYNSDNDEYN